MRTETKIMHLCTIQMAKPRWIMQSKKSALKSKMQTAIRLKRSFILDIGEAITDSLIIRLHII